MAKKNIGATLSIKDGNFTIADFELKEVKQYDDGVVWLNYKKRSGK